MKMKKITLLLIALVGIAQTIDAQNWWKNKIKGEGEVEKKEISVDPFDGFTVAVSANVYIRQGESHEMTVKAQPNIIDNIELKYEGDHLKITYDRPVWRAKRIEIYITTPSVDKIGVSGSGNVRGDSKFKGLDDLQINVSGSGNISFDFEAKAVATRISGSGNVTLNGSGSSISSTISGSGNMNAGGLKVQEANVRVSGSGNITVYATESLEASVSGSGDVRYKGSPERLRSKSSGSGSIRSI